MDTTEVNQQPSLHASGGRSEGAIAPQTCATCSPTDGTDSSDMDSGPSYIYALGQIEARFPNLSLEKEFAQVAGQGNGAGKTDSEMFQTVMSEGKNRYLARQLCWVMTIQGMETYLLRPRDPADFSLLLEALRPAPSPMDIDAVIGLRGPMASPEMCNGLMIPILAFDQIYSFDRETLMGSIPRPEKISPQAFEASSKELFDRVMLLADNAGATDDHRALNYLAMRCPAIYSTVADAHGRNVSLTSVEVRPSPLNGTRNVVDVIFSFTNRNNEFTEKFFVRVDVSEEFPFLAKGMGPYYDR